MFLCVCVCVGVATATGVSVLPLTSQPLRKSAPAPCPRKRRSSENNGIFRFAKNVMIFDQCERSPEVRCKEPSLLLRNSTVERNETVQNGVLIQPNPKEPAPAHRPHALASVERNETALAGPRSACPGGPGTPARCD